MAGWSRMTWGTDRWGIQPNVGGLAQRGLSLRSGGENVAIQGHLVAGLAMQGMVILRTEATASQIEEKFPNATQSN
jgi:hypothetical protein